MCSTRMQKIQIETLKRQPSYGLIFMSDGLPPPPRFAWLCLTRALQVAASPSCLGLATLGLAVMQLGWFASESISGGTAPRENSSLVAIDSTSVRLTSLPPVERWLGDLGVRHSHLPLDPLVGVPAYLLRPGAALFQSERLWSNLGRSVLGLTWHLVVWSLFGLAIARRAVLACGAEKYVSGPDALRFAFRKWSSLVGAPLSVLLAVLLVAIPVYALSWCIRFDFGIFLVGLAWVIVLAFSALTVVLGMGLGFGWPLMWGAIATEESDLFDAVSRSYAYTLQRPGNYLKYLVLAGILGIFGWALACLFAEAVVHMAFWSIQVGGGFERTELLRSVAEHAQQDQVGTLVSWGATWVRWTNQIPWLLVNAFSFAFFWSAAAAIYLLLRFDTDQTAINDVVGV